MSKFNISFKPVNHKVIAVHLDMPYSQAEVYKALQEEEWYEYNAVYDGAGKSKETQLRYYTTTLANPMLAEIQEFFRSDESKRQLIDAVYEYKDHFVNRWGFGADGMFTHSVMSAQFIRDMPGYRTGIHIDPRILYGVGMVFFNGNTERDEDTATYFYDTVERDNPASVDNSFGNGWWLPNDEAVWHDGWNKTEIPRYSIMLGLSIKLSTFTPQGGNYRYPTLPEHVTAKK